MKRKRKREIEDKNEFLFSFFFFFVAKTSLLRQTPIQLLRGFQLVNVSFSNDITDQAEQSLIAINQRGVLLNTRQNTQQ